LLVEPTLSGGPHAQPVETATRGRETEEGQMLRSLIRRIKLFVVVVGAATAVVAGALPASAHDGGSGWVAPHSRPGATCQRDQSGAYMTIHFPQVWAYNATAAIDVQNVYFKAYVQRLENGAWTNKLVLGPVFGQARDDYPVGFWKNASNYSQNYFQVNINLSGSWRTVGEIYWYPTAYVGAGREYSVADHTMPPAAGVWAWCNY
jgi:hypothetical protein